eukprot:9477981-Lingulodinium_polyedra.AAC.1
MSWLRLKAQASSYARTIVDRSSLGAFPYNMSVTPAGVPSWARRSLAELWKQQLELTRRLTMLETAASEPPS